MNDDTTTKKRDLLTELTDSDVTPINNDRERYDIYAYHEEKTWQEELKSKQNKLQKRQQKEGKSKLKMKHVKKKLGPIQGQPLRRLF